MDGFVVWASVYFIRNALVLAGLEIREYGRRDPSRWPRGTLCPQTLALTSPTSGGRSVGIVRSRTQATEFSLVHALALVDESLGHIGNG
jgi:hypothetical protein